MRPLIYIDGRMAFEIQEGDDVVHRKIVVINTPLHAISIMSSANPDSMSCTTVLTHVRSFR